MSSSEQVETTSGRAALIAVAELAELLGVSVRTIWRKESTGHLPAPVRIGGLVRWRRTEIMQWIDDGCPKKGKQ